MKEINNKVRELLLEQSEVTIGFSSGKDSVCALSLILKLGINVTPFYFYVFPDLEFVEKTLRMYEKFFNINIIRLPHPMLHDFIRHQDFMNENMFEFIDEMNIPKETFESLIEKYFNKINKSIPKYDITGERASESFNRRMVFKKYGYIHKNKVKIIADWNKEDVLSYLNKNDIPLSKDYNIWNRSYDGLKYQFLFGVKKHYPNDFKKIKELFPLIELDLYRYETNIKYFAK